MATVITREKFDAMINEFEDIFLREDWFDRSDKIEDYLVSEGIITIKED